VDLLGSNGDIGDLVWVDLVMGFTDSNINILELISKVKV
jgi:hypothetical protein